MPNNPFKFMILIIMGSKVNLYENHVVKMRRTSRLLRDHGIFFG